MQDFKRILFPAVDEAARIIITNIRLGAQVLEYHIVLGCDARSRIYPTTPGTGRFPQLFLLPLFS